MATRQPTGPKHRRKRYCDIKATSLEEIRVTAERHITNIGKTLADLIDNGDYTESDLFYINMFRDTWADLRDDVTEMLAQPKKPESPTAQSPGWPFPTGAPPKQNFVYVIQMTESERGWGQRPDGYLAFENHKDLKAYIHKETKDRKADQVPDEYVIYDDIGIKECCPEFMAKLQAAGRGNVYFDSLEQLKTGELK